MISVGIDVSKGKSTVCILQDGKGMLIRPFEVQHTEVDLKTLSDRLHGLDDEVKIVMEATSIYHLPVLTYLMGAGFFVSVINPLRMKQYRTLGLRRAKTDRLDSRAIAEYGISYWYTMEAYEPSEKVYEELKLLSRQYRHYMRVHVENLLELTHLLDYSMPGIKSQFHSWKESNGKDKLADFVDEFWHYDNITAMTQEQFETKYREWNKEKGYRPEPNKAATIYSMAQDSIPTLPADQTTRMLVHQAVEVLKRVDETLTAIITRMRELSKSLPEYDVVRAMGGVGDTLAPRLIADIGDVRRFHSGKSLVAYAGIDAPPYQSGSFTGTNRKISKRGSAAIRKTGFEVMRSLKSHKEPEDSAVYHFILKKEAEGKPKKVAKIAGLNKFLRIYYARVMEVHST